MAIDWSFAPDDAEAAQEEANELYGCWFKKNDDGVMVIVIGQTIEWSSMGRRDFPYGHVMRPAEKIAPESEKPSRDNAPWPDIYHPAAGTVCEFRPLEADDGDWEKITVLAHWCAPNGITYSWGHKEYGFVAPKPMRFRPIRTPEQIAIEVRSKAITQLMCDLDAPTAIATRAYDKGYRKFEIIDE